MRILTGGTHADSLPRGFSGLLNILPTVGKKRQHLEMSGVREASTPQLPGRGQTRKHEMEGLSEWDPLAPGGSLLGQSRKSSAGLRDLCLEVGPALPGCLHSPS